MREIGDSVNHEYHHPSRYHGCLGISEGKF